jgi:hypothetical protein
MLCDKCRASNLIEDFGQPEDDGEVIDVATVIEWRKEGQRKVRKIRAEVPFCEICGKGSGDADGVAFKRGFQLAASMLTKKDMRFELPREADLSYFLAEGLIELVRIDFNTQLAHYRVVH